MHIIPVCHSQLTLPMTNATPGSELTKEPFRWDQRVFGIVLRLPATRPPATPPSDQVMSFVPSANDTALDAMCEVTGGKHNCNAYCLCFVM